MTQISTGQEDSSQHQPVEKPWLTRWRVIWLIGVLFFVWWTASIYQGHQKLIYFSPQSLTFAKQTRIAWLGTSTPIYTSGIEPDFSRPYLPDFLVEQGYWSPSSDPPTWLLIYDQGYPEKRSWIYRESTRRFHFWMGWTTLHHESQDVWPQLLSNMRNSNDPLDESLFEPLGELSKELSDREVSACEEESVLEGARLLKTFRASHPLPP